MDQRSKLLHSISQEMTQLLGERLYRVILYGSYARGDARPDSDLDILVVIRGGFDYGAMIRKTSETIARLSLENDIVISRAFINQERFEEEASPFILNVHREGIAL